MTTGLDPHARQEVWDLVAEVRRGGATIVLVTHYMDEARRLCDRIALLSGGRKIAEAEMGILLAIAVVAAGLAVPALRRRQ